MMIRYNLCSIIIAMILTFTAIVSAQAFSVAVTISDGSNNDILRVGVDPAGSDFFDIGLDTLAPPAAPPGAFDARLEGIDDNYIVDIRTNTVNEKTFKVNYTPANGSGPIVLSWDNSLLDALGDFRITDNIDGQQFSLDMTTTGSLDVSTHNSLSSSLRILVTPQVAPVLAPIVDITMNEGINLNIAVSANDANGDDITLSANNLPFFSSFTDHGGGNGTMSFSPDFEDSGLYENIEVIATDDRSPPLADTVSFTLTVENVNRAPQLNPINDQSIAEGSTLLIPIVASDLDSDSISLSVNNLPAFGSLTDNGDGSGSLNFTPGFNDAGQYSIEVVATDNGLPALSGTESFLLTINDVVAIEEPGDPTTLPSKPMLLENYPNPFNPATQIRYALPAMMHVRLSVYNNLGQQVALLVNESKPAGYHTALFKTDGQVSGTYFYRFQVDGFQEVRKMLLVR